MDVVKLSNMAERKKVMKAIFHIRPRLLLVLMRVCTQLKPPFWSTISTIVIAPMRKKSVVEVLPKWCSMALLTAFVSALPVNPGR